MKQHIILSITIFVISLFSNPLFGQKKSHEISNDIEIKDIGPLMDGSEAVGYYMFYKVDKVSKGKNSYVLKIMDTELNGVYEKKIIVSDYTYLEKVAYNGKNICLKMYDSKERSFSFRQYDAKAELVSKKTKVLEGKEKSKFVFEKNLNPDNHDLHALKNKGFINIIPGKKKKKKLGYSVMFIPSNEEDKPWTFGSEEESEMIENAKFISYSDGIVVLEIMKSPKLFSFAKQYIAAFDLNKRKKLYEIEIENEGSSTIFLSKTYQKESGDISYLLNIIYEGMKVKGFSLSKIDAKGELLVKKQFLFEGDYGDFFKTDEKGKDPENAMRILFREIVETSDGRIFLIGEEFRKKAGGGGIARGIMTGGAAGGLNMIFGNLKIVELDKNLNLINVETLEKGETSFEFPIVMGVSSPWSLIYMMVHNKTDYLFAMQPSDQSTFSLVYLNREGNIGSMMGNSMNQSAATDKNSYSPPIKPSHHSFPKKGEILPIKSHTYIDKAFVKDDISLDEKECKLYIYPSNKGQILIVKYYPEDKKMEMSIERFNF